MRLFLAIMLPEPVKNRLQQAQSMMRKNGCGRFPPRDSLHLTLVFLGDVHPEAVIRALQDVAVPRLQLIFSGLDCFCDLQYAALCQNEELTRLHSNLCHVLRQAGFSVETRKFTPHVTLCRKFSGTLQKNYPDLTGLQFEADRIYLIQSQLRPEGSIYTPIHEFASKA